MDRQTDRQKIAGLVDEQKVGSVGECVSALVGLARQLLLATWRRCHWQRRSPLRPCVQYNPGPAELKTGFI